ncbi:transcriptional regulator, partial [Salmonella enterica subsp. enterica serovar Agbeni]|nr:transcriptional regulator [Salmonella enterica subsp. enterica serovar Agbeni]EDX4920806.1 transcriptional regulator [Salmonella enterica subsp. enterica]
MSQRASHRDIFCKRLKEARLAAGFSQKKLGIAAGIDEFVASTR